MTDSALAHSLTWTQPAKLSQLRYSIDGWDKETGYPRVLDRDVLLIPNAIPEVFDQLVHEADRHDSWIRPKVVRGKEISEDYSFRNCESVAVRGEGFRGFESVLRGLSGLWASAYKSFVNSHMDVFGIEAEIQLLRYRPGMFFKEHVDSISDNSQFAGRRLTLCAFRGSEDLEGGLLVLRRQRIAVGADGSVWEWLGSETPRIEECDSIGESNLWEQTSDPSRGTIAVFPAGPTFHHWKQEVNRGVAETIVHWYH